MNDSRQTWWIATQTDKTVVASLYKTAWNTPMGLTDMDVIVFLADYANC